MATLTLSYPAWCDMLERRYTTMPLWYWNESRRRAAYNSYVNSRHPGVAMQADLGRIITGKRPAALEDGE